MATLLQQAIELAQAGNQAEAESLLKQVVAQEPGNEAAWMWLSGVTRSRQVKIRALQQVLAINPENQLAQRGLARFSRPAASGPPPVPAEPSSAPPPAGPATPPLFETEETEEIEAPPSLPPPPAQPPTDTPSSLSDRLSFLDEPDEPPTSEPVATEPEMTPAADDTFDWDTFDFGADDDLNFDFSTTPEETASPGGEQEAEEPVEDFGMRETLPSIPDTFDDDLFETTPSIPADSETQAEAEDTFAAIFGEAMADDESPDLEIPDTDAIAGFEPVEEEDHSPTFDVSESTAFNFDDIFSAIDTSPQAPAEPEEIEEEETDGVSSRLGAFVGGDDDEEASIELDETEEEAKAPAFDAEAFAQQAIAGKHRQRRQQTILIFSTAVFVSAIICIALLVLLDNSVGRYTFPFFTPPEQLTLEVSSGTGTGTANFKGYPATQANIKWTRDNEAETCEEPGTGLTVDFGTGDTSTISNQVCLGDNCGFEKQNLNGQPVTAVTVTYICGRDAVITLGIAPLPE